MNSLPLGYFERPRHGLGNRLDHLKVTESGLPCSRLASAVGSIVQETESLGGFVVNGSLDILQSSDKNVQRTFLELLVNEVIPALNLGTILANSHDDLFFL